MNANILNVRDLSLRISNKFIFKNISVDIEKNKVTSIVGPSGVGKSSFLLCLNRLIETIPSAKIEGQILLEEKSTIKIEPTFLRRSVGMLFQKPSPFPFSIKKNFLVPLRSSGITNKDECLAIIESTLSEVGLWEEVKDRLNHSALNLSGGQQQRLCLARALALKPRVLLLDEPCSALDPISSRVIEELVIKLKSNLSFVIVTHNLAQAKRVSDNMAFLWWRDNCGYLETFASKHVFFSQTHSAHTQEYISSQQI